MNTYDANTSCCICNTALTGDGSDGRWINLHGNKRWVCPVDAAPFSTGLMLGRIDVHQKIVACLASLPDNIDGEELKRLVYSMVPEAKRRVTEFEKLLQPTHRTPREVFAALNQHAVGQLRAKELISLAVYQHIRSLARPQSPVARDRHHVLLLGPTGVGKTLLAQSSALSLGVPFTAADATSFSPTGFQGADADSMIYDLVQKSDGIIPVIQRSVVFIDEIDKLAATRSGNTGDHLNLSTQAALLRLVEGKDVKVPATYFGGEHNAPPVPVSTAQMLFMLGGAFPGLEKLVAQEMGYAGRGIGFRGSAKEDAMEQAMANYDILRQAPADAIISALIKFGMSGELIGRIPVLVPLAPLTKEELRTCLTGLDHSPLAREQRLFAECGYDLVLTPEAEEALLDQALTMSTGTRALHALSKHVTFRAAFDLLGDPTNVVQGKVILDADCLSDPGQYRFEKATKRVTLAAIYENLAVTA